MNDPDSFMHGYERHRQFQAKVNQGNKDAVFDALAAAGITEVHADFDGEGDSGQINGVSARSGNDRAELPNTLVTMRQISWGCTEAVSTAMPMAVAIETLCYDFLEETHGGWENNDGASGEFRFDVAKRAIELEFNGRFTDISTDHHTL